MNKKTAKLLLSREDVRRLTVVPRDLLPRVAGGNFPTVTICGSCSKAGGSYECAQ